MRKLAYISIAIMAFFSCSKTENRQAEELLSQIQTLYEKGSYSEALDSIESLRSRFPKAIACRKEALHIYQEASLVMAQQDVLLTDSALQATIVQIDQAKTLLEANMLRQKRDSLKARYEAMCGVVRMIHMRQEQCCK
ncbi:MAG: hypothetical protein IJ196_01765 [Prevotella sp.]|nr:hypothetical protein [Prevotella sp.]